MIQAQLCWDTWTAATEMMRANRMKNAPLQDMVKVNKEKRRSSDVVTDVSLNITAVR